VSTISDVDLVAAIEQTYRDGYRRFLSLAVGMLGDVDRARDAVQEAFAHALRHRGDLREAESLHPWLWRIVVNVCRVEKRHSVIGLDESYELEANGQVVFRYCDAEGNVTAESNPNGAARNIAGVCNRERNVLGMMPHPERCSEEVLGNADGLGVFRSIVAAFAAVK